MRNRNGSNRARVVIPATLAAIIPAVVLLPQSAAGNPSDGVRGAMVGVLIGISITALVLAVGPNRRCNRTAE